MPGTMLVYVQSGAMRDFAYDEERRILQVEFVSGSVYQYFEVPKSVFVGLFLAESKGRFFNQVIKPAKYRSVRIR